MTSLIFKQLADLGIKTHMVSFDLDKNSMDVKKAAALWPMALSGWSGGHGQLCAPLQVFGLR